VEKGEGEDEDADLYKARRNYTVTFMGKMLATEPINAQKKKRTLERMEAEKKAKLVGHTSWPI